MTDRTKQSQIVFKKVLIQKGLDVDSGEEPDFSDGNFSLNDVDDDDVVDLLAENNALTNIIINA